MGTKLWMDFREARNVETGMSHLIRELEMREKSKGTHLTGKQCSCGSESQPASGTKRRRYPCSWRRTDSTNYQKYVFNPPGVLRNSPWGYCVILPGVLRNSPRGYSVYM